LQLAAALTSVGIDTVFSARGDGSCLKRSRELGVPFVPLPMRRWNINSLISLLKVIRQKNVRVVHVHKGLAHSLALGAAYLLPRPPIVVANRGVSFRLEPWNRWRYKSPLTKVVVAVSHSVRELLERENVPPEKVRVIQGSADLNRFSSSRRHGVRKEMGITRDAFVVGFISAMRPWKNHVRFAELMAPIMVNNPQVHCLFAGGEKPKVRRAVVKVMKDAGLQGRFHLLGYRNDVERIMAACDLTVNLSTAGEGMPGVLRESMACGVPVAATPVAGNPEVVIDGYTGCVLDPSGARLPGSLVSFKDNPRLRISFGKNGRRFMEDSFSVDRRLRRMVNIYRKAIDE
jgi:glycosyltransferase involved in cell wall biosynthesis